MAEYPHLLQQRAVEGLIAVDTAFSRGVALPVVAVSGYTAVPGVTNIVLNHARAATLALQHVIKLGHRQLAFIKGQVFSSDTQVRWESMRAAAAELGLEVNEKLVVQLEGESATSDLGFTAAQKLLATADPFTALIAFNDISAIGSIQALREAGRRVWEDISVVGFDDIQSARYTNPALTTVRQPLREMGSLAAETLLQRIAGASENTHTREIVVEPELIIRASTGPAPPSQPY